MIHLAQLKAEKAKRSLAEFIRQAWPVLEPGIELKWGWHLDAICDHLEAISRGEVNRLMINVPPGHMKSLSVAVFWPAWVWLRNPGWRVLFTTYARDLTFRDSVKCREVIQSDWYQASFKPEWELANDQNVKGYFKNTAMGERVALSVGGLGTGFRGDCVVFDDPMNVEEFPTSDSLNKVTSWWDKRMTSRLNDMEKGAFVGIMQRIHEGDLAGHLLSKGGKKWEHLNLPSEFEPENRCVTSIFKDPRTKRGELLFPEKFPRSVIEQAKIDLGDQFNAQHQQKPTAQSGGIFQRHWWRFWYPANKLPPKPIITDVDGVKMEHVQEPLPDISFIVQSWDMAFKGNDSSDFVCGQVWGVKASRFYLLDQVHDRMTFTESKDEVEALCEKWPQSTAKYIEDKANGPAVIDSLRGDIGGIVGIEPKGGKEARAHAAAPSAKAGQIYLPHPDFAPWVKGLLDELTKFPRAKHDDRTDALTQAINELRNNTAAMLHAMTKDF